MSVESGAAGPVTVDAQGEERVWRAGKLPPMKIRKLPEAPAAAHVLGPAMILVALGVGFGETYLWPRLVIVFGADIRWLFTLGVIVQTVVMLEMARYAMATGESIFFGAARVWQPLMWMFFLIAALVYIWPGHISGGAEALEEITGISWQLSATVALIIIGIMFTVVRYIYNLIEGLLAFAVGVLVIGSAIVGAIVGSMHDLGTTIAGTVRVDTWIPSEAFTAAFFPVVVIHSASCRAMGCCSRCGTRSGCATRVREWAHTNRASVGCSTRTRRRRSRKPGRCSTWTIRTSGASGRAGASG